MVRFDVVKCAGSLFEDVLIGCVCSVMCGVIGKVRFGVVFVSLCVCL